MTGKDLQLLIGKYSMYVVRDMPILDPLTEDECGLVKRNGLKQESRKGSTVALLEYMHATGTPETSLVSMPNVPRRMM